MIPEINKKQYRREELIETLRKKVKDLNNFLESIQNQNFKIEIVHNNKSGLIDVTATEKIIIHQKVVS